MADSPLELYEKAYRAHYTDNDVSGARRIYESIIREFPETNEAGYSVIQLQKITAAQVGEGSETGPAGGGGVLMAVSVVLNIVTLAAIVFALVAYLMGGLGGGGDALDISQALGKMYSGQDAEALGILEGLKVRMGGQITPFALAADVYVRRGEFRKAQVEYEQYRKLYPTAQVPQALLEGIKRAEAGATHAGSSRAAASESAAAEQDAQKAEAEAKKDRSAEKKKSTPVSPKKQATRQNERSSGSNEPGKPDLIVHPDSVSFF